jgi:hypothetical protein
MSVRIVEVKGEKDLYCHYDRQTTQQDCYVEIDCADRTITATYNSEIGNAKPIQVLQGHFQRFGIPCLTAKAANALMVEILPLVEKVCDGYSAEWDGNNMIAQFSETALLAMGEIERACAAIDPDEYNTVQVIDAATYLDGILTRVNREGEPCRYNEQPVIVEIKDIGTITGESLPHEIKAIVEEIEEGLQPNEVIEGLEEYLTDECDNCHDSGFSNSDD